jgi:hypothetical protein
MMKCFCPFRAFFMIAKNAQSVALGWMLLPLWGALVACFATL